MFESHAPLRAATTDQLVEEGHVSFASSRSSAKRRHRRSVSQLSRALAVEALLAIVLAASPAQAQAPSDPSAQGGEREEQAREHFRRGVTHVDSEQWDAALAEFLRSRELVITKANTKNAAICARKIGRLVDALELFQALLRDFADLPAADRQVAQAAIGELSRSVGSIEIRGAPAGASLAIDAVMRGTMPLPMPLRLAAGAHVVRVAREGLLPFEAHVDLAGEETVVLNVKLTPLTRTGLLRVTERNGGSLEVVIDGTSVGATPWEGALAPGGHSVLIRGSATLGTAPRTALVELGRLTKLDLTAAPLPAAVRITSRPASADIAIDGVSVGRGAWFGRLEAGPHRIDVSALGHLPLVRTVVLAPERELPVSVALAEAPASRTPHARIAIDAEIGGAVGLVWGGDLLASCGGRCSATLPLGALGGLHALYELPSRFGFGIHAGYLRIGESIASRPEQLAPVGRGVLHDGVANDELRVGGLLLDGIVEYSSGGQWPTTVRFGAGALIGAVTDRRSGSFGEDGYRAGGTQSPRAQFVYVAPELRWSRRLAGHFNLGLGLRVVALAPVGSPSWSAKDTGVLTSGGDLAYFPSNELTGRLLLLVAPLLSGRFE